MFIYNSQFPVGHTNLSEPEIGIVIPIRPNARMIIISLKNFIVNRPEKNASFSPICTIWIWIFIKFVQNTIRIWQNLRNLQIRSTMRYHYTPNFVKVNIYPLCFLEKSLKLSCVYDIIKCNRLLYVLIKRNWNYG